MKNNSSTREEEQRKESSSSDWRINQTLRNVQGYVQFSDSSKLFVCFSFLFWKCLVRKNFIGIQDLVGNDTDLFVSFTKAEKPIWVISISVFVVMGFSWKRFCLWPFRSLDCSDLLKSKKGFLWIL